MLRRVLFLSLCLSSFYLSAAELFSERLNYKILTPDKPTAVQTSAAAELDKFLAKTYQQAIVLNGDSSPMVFLVGVSDEAILAGFTQLPRLEDNFGLFRLGRSILFHGYDDDFCQPAKSTRGQAGTLLAVYYFLRQYAGCRFYYPGEQGYSLSPEQELRFDASEDLFEPSFTLRGFSLRTRAYSSEDLALFSRRMLCSQPLWAGMDIYYIYLNRWKKRFFAEHPEYFMLRDGERVAENYPNHMPCFSNPAVIRQTAADIIKQINQSPGKKCIKIFSDAPINLCQCPQCQAMPERQLADPELITSEAVYGFQKRIADIIHQSHPDVYFLTQTKGKSYYAPPRLCKLGERFTVNILASPHLCNVSSLSFAVDVARQWQAAGQRSMFFGYPRYTDKPTKNMPVMTPQFNAEYLRLFAGLSSGTISSEMNFNPYSFSALNQFVQARLLFEVNSDVAALIQEFCAFAYPGAEKEMAGFYQAMEQLYIRRRDISENPYYDVYSADKLAAPWAWLNEAQAKVKDDSQFFAQLYQDFQQFYEGSQKEEENSRKLAAWNEQRLQASTGTLKLPLASSALDWKSSAQLWPGALKLDFSAPQQSEDFQAASLYLLCDSAHLYLGIVAQESNMAALQASCQENFKGNFWNDDNFEIMLVPDKAGSYEQIVINANAAYRVLTQPKTRDNREFQMETHAQKLAHSWLLSMKIPLSQFETAPSAQPWHFNAFRNRAAGAKQNSGIRMLGPNFHILDDYVKIIVPPQNH